MPQRQPIIAQLCSLHNCVLRMLLVNNQLHRKILPPVNNLPGCLSEIIDGLSPDPFQPADEKEALADAVNVAIVSEPGPGVLFYDQDQYHVLYLKVDYYWWY
jgi:hypothetical protein